MSRGSEGVSTPIVCLLWSKSVEKLEKLELFPVVWFVYIQRNVQVNSKRNKKCHYKAHDNVHSAHWPDVSGAGATRVNAGRIS